MTDKLKPCPFCGGEAARRIVRVKIPYSKDGHYIECPHCGTHSDLYFAEEEAIKLWNTRKPMDRIVEQLEKELYRGMEGLEPVKVSFNFGINTAIEIVKAGGKDE